MGAPLTSYPELQKILPSAYKYNINGFADLNETGQNYLNKCNFRTSFQLNLKNKLEVKLWIKDFEKTCGMKWQVSKTYLGWGSRGNVNVYQVDLKCHHTASVSSTAVKEDALNSTCCPANMSVMVKEGTQVVPDGLCHLCTDELVSSNPWKRNHTEFSPLLGGVHNTLDGEASRKGKTQIAYSQASQCEDLCSREFPTYVYLSFQHNHQVSLPEHCEKESVSKIKQKLIALYRTGYTPLTALEALKHDLQKDYYFMAGDRAQVPDKQFCYRVYYSMFSRSSLPRQPSSNETSVDLHHQQCDEINKRLHVNHNTKFTSPLDAKLHINQNKHLLERQLHGHSKTFFNKSDMGHCKLLNKPVSSTKLDKNCMQFGEEIESSYNMTSNNDILVDIHNKLSSDHDERLKPYCKTYQFQCADAERSDEEMLSDLQDNLKRICGMYNLKCANIEKCDDQVIVAVCSPLTKMVSNEISDNEECEYNSSEPEDMTYLECESVPVHFHSETYANESTIEHCIEDMRTVFDDLLTKVEYNPEVFVKPMAVFFKNYHRIKKDNDLKSALHTFGKYTNLTMPIIKSLKGLHVGDSVEGEQNSTVYARKRKSSYENCQQKCLKIEEAI
ncbi:uncharacterized protein [Procambarus clarkii]|uniref:uncharacterized protein isoform X1 n=2 Tax=Procambarus clarkii TaxID=6728 RepID=UPI003743530F